MQTKTKKYEKTLKSTKDAGLTGVVNRVKQVVFHDFHSCHIGPALFTNGPGLIR